MVQQFPPLLVGLGPLSASAHNLSWYREQVTSMGHSYLWQAATRCPSFSKYVHPQTTDASYTVKAKGGPDTCPLCGGTGYLYEPAQPIRALHHDIAADPEWLKVYGVLLHGSCGITFLPEHLPKLFDRLTDLSETRIYTERFTRLGEEDQPTYPILVEGIVAGSEADNYVPQTYERSVISLRRATADGQPVDVPLEPGVDYEITSEGKVRWLGGGVYTTGLLMLSTPDIAMGTLIPRGSIIPGPSTDYVTAADVYATELGSGVGVGFAVMVTAATIGTAGNLTIGDTFVWSSVALGVTTGTAQALSGFANGTSPVPSATGGYATGLALLTLDSAPIGTEIPVGTLITLTDSGLQYATTTAAYTYSSSGDTVTYVPVRAVERGTASNIAPGTFACTSDMVDGPVSFQTFVTFTGGAEQGGNVPDVGDEVSISYVCRPVFIVRKMPHMARTSLTVETPPYVNPCGYKGAFDASSGAFPDGTDLLAGDYFEVSVAGTVDGVAFIPCDVLLALVDMPGSTYSGNWRRMRRTDAPALVQMHLPTMAMCWLEELGDPLARINP